MEDTEYIELRGQMAALEMTLAVLLAVAFQTNKGALDTIHAQLTDNLSTLGKLQPGAEHFEVAGTALLDRMIGGAKAMR